MHCRRKTLRSHNPESSWWEFKENKEAETFVQGATSADNQNPPGVYVHGWVYTTICKIVVVDQRMQSCLLFAAHAILMNQPTHWIIKDSLPFPEHSENVQYPSHSDDPNKAIEGE